WRLPCRRCTREPRVATAFERATTSRPAPSEGPSWSLSAAIFRSFSPASRPPRAAQSPGPVPGFASAPAALDEGREPIFNGGPFRGTGRAAARLRRGARAPQLRSHAPVGSRLALGPHGLSGRGDRLAGIFRTPL